MAAIDAEYWNKCVSKVMKEVHQYMIYDGLIPEDVIEESPLDVDIPENDEIVPFTNNSLPSSSKENNDELKKLIVKQCTEGLISPTKLAEMHKKNEKTIRSWIKSSGAQFPSKYLEKAQRKISFTSFYEEKSLLTANDATQRLTKQLILNLKSNWPSLSKTIDSQPSSSNSTNSTNLEPDLEKKSKWDEKNFQCPKCSFKTSLKHNLDRHLNFHNDCVYCGKVFFGNSAKRQLASHLKTHTERNLRNSISMCIFCDRDYKQSSNLKKHMKVCKKKPHCKIMEIKTICFLWFNF